MMRDDFDYKACVIGGTKKGNEGSLGILKEEIRGYCSFTCPKVSIWEGSRRDVEQCEPLIDAVSLFFTAYH